MLKCFKYGFIAYVFILSLVLFVYFILTLFSFAYAQEEAPPIVDLSETETSYMGARLLRSDEDVIIGELEEGIHEDVDERDRYIFWQGDSLFLGVIDSENNNRLDAVAEFYWFESSLPRNSDFYVIVLKVTASPTPNTNWRIATPPSFVDMVLFRDIGAVHRVQAILDRDGSEGAIRWDWSLPFQNYRWEPERVIEVQQEYTAGAHVEGSAMRDLSEGVNVQAKGFLDAQTRVSTRYTITLWRWEMLVQAGATDMDWALIALSPEHEQDPAYHEYFLVLQSEREIPVRIRHLQFATTMRNRRPLFPDQFGKLSARLNDVVLFPPRDPCMQGFVLEDGLCIPDCAPGSEIVGGVCQVICPAGFEAVQNECLPICLPNMVVVANQCQTLCEDGSVAINGRCDIDCEVGELRVDGECVPNCGVGFNWQNNECVPQCPPGTLYNGDVCACPENSRFDGIQCLPDCPVGALHDGVQCICQEGFQMSSHGCVPACSGNFHFDGMQCVPVCEEGTTLIDNECISLEDTCADDYVWCDGSCQLACRHGYHFIGGICDRICSEDHVFQDQRCIPRCPIGMRFENDRCLEIVGFCPSGMGLKDGVCVSEYYSGENSLVPPSSASSDYTTGCSSSKMPFSSLFMIFGIFWAYIRKIRQNRLNA